MSKLYLKIQFWSDLTQSQHTISSFECSLQACFFHSLHFWGIFWLIIWMPKHLMTFVVGKFKPFGYCALKCTYLVWLILHQTLKRAREEPSLSANVGRIWYKTYVLYANISKMFKKKTRDQNMSCYMYCSINTSFGFIIKFNYFRFTAFCNISSMVEWVPIP